MRPVNSTFIQYSADDNPNDLFNGEGIASSWTKVTLSESYIQLDSTKTAGTTISATAKTENHTLTINEMPVHSHSFTNRPYHSVHYSGQTSGTGGNKYAEYFEGTVSKTDDSGGDTGHSHNLSNVHPKGQTAILWKRTA